MSEAHIEYVPLTEVQRWPRNPKQHAFGFVDPLIIDENSGKLVAGHGRLEALAKLKQEGKPRPTRIRESNGEWLVPVLRGVGFKEAKEAEAYLIADNQTVMLGGWDDKLLRLYWLCDRKA